MFLKLLLIFTVSFSALGQEKKKVSKKPAVSSVEVESFLEALKEKEVEKQLLGSEQFKECKSKNTDIDALRLCIAEKLNKLDDATITALGEKFNLSAFDKKASKSYMENAFCVSWPDEFDRIRPIDRSRRDAGGGCALLHDRRGTAAGCGEGWC